ncbi:uncharacterized protein F4822DRAFT_223520 [Hypoxylon trugodes]|uniref:uncharacterized protein n=1 Tax=Hypoxylon trugodes TaxID=326681 RepID=UPI00219334C7|nr:uncharacterized protein F4822DRAFT_223520 [Hypoxylon trugodes]KAI1390078.1 hypothetical protein F4822DRAFT_223520 [Hypoxylon trugodes]
MDSLNFGKSLGGDSGWRQAAKVNCTILVCMSITLIGCLISAATRGDGLYSAYFFYEGQCDGGGSVPNINLILHLVINIVSTLVVTSSNFFMQVLNSPSREEVNTAHFKGSWMGIGIPSVRNAFMVSRFKTWSWACLLISSIPLHLIFNSTIFQVDQRDSDFHLTIATEDFLNGGPYYAPGGSLLQPGFDVWYTHENLITESIYNNISDFNIASREYGFPVNLTDYASKDTAVMKNISDTALKASGWNRLETGECKQEYIDCGGLKYHRDLVLVVDKPGGWIRNDTWHLMDNQTKYWDTYIPADKPNNLFFGTQCVMAASRSDNEPTQCVNTCLEALGYYSTELDYSVSMFAGETGWQYPFIQKYMEKEVNGTSNGEYTTYNITAGSALTSGLQPGALNLTVKYCLAEPLDRVCHIGLSPTLLLAVTICVIFKTGTAIVVTVVLARQNHSPLVTLGDAMESFIEKPDATTAGMSTIGQSEIRRAMRSGSSFLSPGPRQWQALRRRRWSVVPKSVWATSYLLFIIGISICSFFVNSVIEGGGLFGSFMESDENAFIDIPTTFVNGVLLANSPQLLLSFCYLAYNNLFTRLQMAREWAMFSQGYHALRVTDPKGDQYSTYRLQLPYKYSIPLMGVSIFLHWLLSNTIYVFISMGGYFGTSEFLASNLVDPTLPPSTAVAVGFSGLSLVALLSVSCFLILIPFFLSFKKLPSNMVIVGSNSLALSAACHVPSLSNAVPSKFKADPSPGSSKIDLPSAPRSPEQSRILLAGDAAYADESFEMQHLRAKPISRISSNRSMSSKGLLVPERSSEDSLEEGEEEELGRSQFTKLARSKIRWGIVKMPPEWHAEYDNDAGPVEHLSFGVEEDDVQPPEVGDLYA